MCLPLVMCEYKRMLTMWRSNDRKTTLEKPMAKNTQSFEHHTTKRNRIDKRSALNVLDHARKFVPLHQRAHGLNQFWIRTPRAIREI
jgi:hypothetical protein